TAWSYGWIGFRSLVRSSSSSLWANRARLCSDLQLFQTAFDVTHPARPCSRPHSGGTAPVHPVADRFAHGELEVAALEPRQFLGEQGHALPPGARHPGDVGAPEHPLGTEGVEAVLQVRMQAAERVFVLGVAC